MCLVCPSSLTEEAKKSNNFFKTQNLMVKIVFIDCQFKYSVQDPKTTPSFSKNMEKFQICIKTENMDKKENSFFLPIEKKKVFFFSRVSFLSVSFTTHTEHFTSGHQCVAVSPHYSFV